MAKPNPRTKNGHRRRELCKWRKAQGLPCALCGQPIDYGPPAGNPIRGHRRLDGVAARRLRPLTIEVTATLRGETAAEVAATRRALASARSCRKSWCKTKSCAGTSI